VSGLGEYLAGSTDGPGGQTIDLIPLPRSGEVLNLTGSDEHLVTAFDELREFEAEVKTVRTAVADELRRRLDRSALWTRHVGRFKVSAPSPEPKTEYDVDRLRDALAEMVGEGLIDQEAASKALKRDVSYTPVIAGIKALKKLGGDVKDAIEACEMEVERTSRPVTVKIEPNGRGI